MAEKSQEKFWRLSQDEAKEVFGGQPDMILASQAAWDMYVKHMEGLKTRDHVKWLKWRFRG